MEWGVMFSDGSVKHPWNGRTAMQRAMDEAVRLDREYAPDQHLLVCRRSPDAPWFPYPDDDYWVAEDGTEMHGDLPRHFRIGVNAQGQGPVDPPDPDFQRWVCWCGLRNCHRYLVVPAEAGCCTECGKELPAHSLKCSRASGRYY